MTTNLQQRGGGFADLSQPKLMINNLGMRPHSSNLASNFQHFNKEEPLMSKSIEVMKRDDQQQATGFKHLAGKHPPQIMKGLNQSMIQQNVASAQPHEHAASKLDRSLDSINLLNHKKPPLRSTKMPVILDQSLTSHQNNNFGVQVLHQDTKVGAPLLIKGRKMDSPHLVIVREKEEVISANANHISRLNRQRDGLNNSGVLMVQQQVVPLELGHNSTVLENHHKPRTAKSQENHNRRQMKQNAVQTKPTKNGVRTAEKKGTKSSRDVKSSLAFNEIVNHIHHDNEQQSSHPQDFKNKTQYDNQLKEELSEIHRQKQALKSKSRSRDRAVKNTLSCKPTAILPKALCQGGGGNQRVLKTDPSTKPLGTQLNTDSTPNKTAAGNGHDRPHTSQSHANAHNNKRHHSPKGTTTTSNANILHKIDWLVKQNNARMKTKIEEERKQRQESEERQRRKREMVEMSNSIVRQVNKERTYAAGTAAGSKNKHQILNVHVALGNQQSQDFVCPSGAIGNVTISSGCDMTNTKISKKADSKQKNLNLSQLCQSQKLDFRKLKEKVRDHQALKNQHRKSYGLEFIEIKKEIQEELHTLDHYHNRGDLILPPHHNQTIITSSQENSSCADDLLNDSQHTNKKIPPKKLNIKKPAKLSLPINEDDDANLAQGHQYNKTERGGSDEQSHEEHHETTTNEITTNNPKVIIINKSKIRKFMKMKKREREKEQQQQEQSEMMRVIKMQENMMKLNEFCKKNLLKNVHKKRNATIQHIQGSKGCNGEGEHNVINQSKISGRKINFEKANDQHHYEEESSRLSTEFYEEYYKAIKSLKKDHKDTAQQLSRQRIVHSPTSKSLMNPTQNQTTLIPASKDESLDQSKIPPKQSKSSLSHTANALKSKAKRLKTTTSRMKPPPVTFNLGEGHKALLKKRQSQSRERSESAPLQKRKSVAASSSSRLNNTTLNESMKKSSSGQSKERKVNKLKPNENLAQNEKPMTEIEMELLRIYLNNQVTKIQQAYREHLFKKGFYHHQQDSAQTVQRQVANSSQTTNSHKLDYLHHPNQSAPYINSEEDDQNVGDTVRRDEQHLNGDENLDYTIQEAELLESDQLHLNEEEDHIRAANPEEDSNFVEDDQDEDDDYDDEDEYSEEPHPLIIINEQPDDDKKVVYLSNINSCSLPQTPKLDEQPANVSNLIEKRAQEQKQEFIKEQKMVEGSSPSAIGSKESQTEQKPEQCNPEQADQKLSLADLDYPDDLLQTEEKVKDYGLRLFAGSESLLLELKLSTPKEQKGSAFRMNERDQTSGRNGGSRSKRNLTSHGSEQSLLESNQIDTNSVQHNIQQQDQYLMLQQLQLQTQSSVSQSSHHSLFERNSFQKYTATKLQHLIANNEFLNLITMREKALDYRQEKERKYIKKMFKTRQFSPRTYSQKKEQLEKWVRLEMEDIQKTKVQFQEEWDRTVQMIEETQKNVEIMREQIRGTSDPHHSVRGQRVDLQSSRNSSASYATTSYKHERKSILDQEEFMPLSHRSNRLKSNAQQNGDQIMKMTRQTEATMNNENKPSLTLDKPLTIEGGQQSNLIDFLEDSWKRSQASASKANPQLQTLSNTDQMKKPSATVGRIFIEDQNQEQSHQNLLSPNSDKHFSYDDEACDSSHPQQLRKVQQTEIIPVSNNESGREEERQLIHSRSEQDLTELIKNTKKTIQEEEDQQEDSFHVLESDRYDQPKQEGGNNADIKIQENLFEDSSQFQLSIQQHPHIDHEIPSQDSLLNEQEFNHHFKAVAPVDHKFSIEDFKLLDKRQLLNNDDDNDELDLIIGDDDDIIVAEEKLITEGELKSSSVAEESDQPGWSHEQKGTAGLYSASEQSQRSESLVAEHGFIQQQQQMPSSFLFQNAKPGENIKISDILKQKQHVRPFQEEGYHFQNEKIVQNLTATKEEVVVDEKEIIASNIAEEILQMLIQSEVQIPEAFLKSRQKKHHHHHVHHLELSPESPSPLIVPQLIHHEMPMQHQLLQNQDVFIVDATYNEKEQRRELIDLRQRMLIESDLQRIENYINEIINSLQQHELNYLEMISGGNPQLLVEPNFHRQFLQVLTCPIKRSYLDVLNQLQTSEIGSYEHFETTMDITQHPILPVDLYLDIERQREEQHLRVLGQADHDIENSVIQESIHIHNKGIFDALNESLMKFRPCGIQGEPMPWSNKVRRLQTKVDTSQVDTERLFFMVKQDVMRWASNCVGCLPSQVFVVRRQLPNSPIPLPAGDHFDDEIFQETRERRLAQMLASEVVETEHHWMNYEFEESQVKIDMSDMILEHLVEEVVSFLNAKVRQQQ